MFNKMDNILKYFIENPEKEFHIRQLSKLEKKSPATISKYLKKYEKEGILKSKEKLKHLLFKADAENKKFKILKLNYNLKLIENSGIIDYINKEFNYPEAIILFGSFAKAENIPKSDIDLFIASPLKKNLDLKKYEKKIKHEVQLMVHSKKELKKMSKTNKELVNKILNGIVIEGHLEFF